MDATPNGSSPSNSLALTQHQSGPPLHPLVLSLGNPRPTEPSCFTPSVALFAPASILENFYRQACMQQPSFSVADPPTPLFAGRFSVVARLRHSQAQHRVITVQLDQAFALLRVFF